MFFSSFASQKPSWFLDLCFFPSLDFRNLPGFWTCVFLTLQVRNRGSPKCFSQSLSLASQWEGGKHSSVGFLTPWSCHNSYQKGEWWFFQGTFLPFEPASARQAWLSFKIWAVNFAKHFKSDNLSWTRLSRTDFQLNYWTILLVRWGLVSQSVGGRKKLAKSERKKIHLWKSL